MGFESCSNEVEVDYQMRSGGEDGDESGQGQAVVASLERHSGCDKARVRARGSNKKKREQFNHRSWNNFVDSMASPSEFLLVNRKKSKGKKGVRG